MAILQCSRFGVLHKSNKSPRTTLGNDSSKYWLTQNVFLIGVAGLLTLVFALVMIFKRKELAKDAQYGAIGYFVIIMVIQKCHNLLSG